MGSTSAWNKKHYCHHVKVVEAKLSFQLSSSLAVFAPIFLVHRGPAAQRQVPATAAQSRASFAGGHAAC